jgi:hypothetical protein
MCDRRYLLHVGYGDVHDIGYYDGDRFKLPPSVTGHVRNAALGKSRRDTTVQ